MIFINSTIVLLLSLSFASCSRQFQIAKITPGQTDLHTAVDVLDEPLTARRSTLSHGSEVYAWEDVTVQVEENMVKAVHRRPAGHEKTLQFWRQYFKDSHTIFGKVQDPNGASEALWQLNIPSKGINVVYDERSDQVVRVIKYEAH